MLEWQTQSRQTSTSNEAESSPTPQQVLGLHESMGWTSDDFNDLLLDEFWKKYWYHTTITHYQYV